MLDSRTSLPTERAQRATVRAKGAGLLEALTARPAQPDGLSFGSVLSNTLSDRRASPASRDRAAAVQASSSAEPGQGTPRKAAQRNSDRDESADAVAQGESQRTDRPDAPESASADHQAGNADASEPKDLSSMDAAQPTADAAAPDSAQQATVAAAAEASSSATAGDPANPAAGTDAAAPGQPSPAKTAIPGLTPLQWMAQQQVARLSAQTEQARAAIPVHPADTNTPPLLPGAAAPNKQAAPAAMPAAQQAMADLVGPAASSSALGVLKALQDGSSDSPSRDPDATATTQGSPTQTRSATADPAGLLLNPSDGSTYAAASRSHSPSAPSHAMAGSPAGAQPNVTLPPTADDNAVQNMQRLAAMVHAKVGQGHSVARMQLQPPELGAVTAVVLLRQGKMDLRLEVANEAARDLMTDGLGRLRDSLQQQGISLDRATVNVAPRNEHAGNDQQQPAWTGPQDNNPSGQFQSGQGQEQGDRSFAASLAMDVPAGAGEGAGDLPAGAIYAAGLNVLA
jgi:flagellar hook-length control protein FliK